MVPKRSVTGSVSRPKGELVDVRFDGGERCGNGFHCVGGRDVDDEITGLADVDQGVLGSPGDPMRSPMEITRVAGFREATVKKLNGARFRVPSAETVETHAIGRGCTEHDSNLYTSPSVMAPMS